MSLVFKQVRVGAHEVFAYILGDQITGEAVVVDPAGSTQRLIALAAQSGCRIKSIINTHGHVDHIMGNAQMKERTKADIYIHEAEASYLMKIGQYWLDLFSARKSPPADHVLQDQDTLQIGSWTWQVLHTPGHSPGSICLYQAQSQICLTGDTLFVGSVGRTDGPISSTIQMMDSIRTRLLSLPPETKVYPGHDYGISAYSTIEDEKKNNPFINEFL